jgi:hypothetical protein
LLSLLTLFEESPAKRRLHLHEVGEELLSLRVGLDKFKVLLILAALDTQTLDVVE